MDTVQCYIYAYELTARDKLTDGPDGTSFDIASDTLLIWVDLHPDMRFAHPTLYVLISGVKTRVEKGEWWPELNGRRILYGCRNPVAVLSPFELEMPAPQN